MTKQPPLAGEKTVPSEGRQPLPGKGLQRKNHDQDDLVDQGSGTFDPAAPHPIGPQIDHANNRNE